MSPRSLIVDSRGPSGRDRVRSRGEALQQLAADEYDAIDLYTSRPGRDDYQLVEYLAGTWPAFLHRVTVRTITRGRPSATWSHESSSFVLTAPARLPARRRRIDESPSIRVAASARG
jgi:hypothetical protein